MASKDDQEKELLDFLDSLPEDEGSATGADAVDDPSNDKKEGVKKDDDDILNFLDELEETNKNKSKEVLKIAKDGGEGVPKDSLKKSSEKQNTESETPGELNEQKKAQAQAQAQAQNQIQESGLPQTGNSDPISSLTSWWSKSGSNAVSSIWGTAQSLSEQATKQAEEALKKASEEALKLAKENERVREAIEIADTQKAINGLNNGLNFVVDKFQNLNVNGPIDEIIEVVLIHDMKIERLNEIIKNKFENVMEYQVEGNIEIKVIERKVTETEKEISLSLFNGKGSDAEKLLIANIENEIKNDKEKEENATGLNTTKIYLSLISWTSSKDDEIKKQKDIVIDSHSPSSFTLSVVLKDLKNEISILNTSQPLPMKWSKWIEGNFELNEEDVDPSDWVIGWFYNTLGNLIGITLQSYIIKRMGY